MNSSFLNLFSINHSYNFKPWFVSFIPSQFPHPVTDQSIRQIQFDKSKGYYNDSIPVRGQQHFNTLARDIRNMTGCKVDIFKRRLDKQVLGYTAQQRADWNSIIDMGKSLPTGHHKWKCLLMQVHPAEEVAITALPGYSDAQGYHKVTR